MLYALPTFPLAAAKCGYEITDEVATCSNELRMPNADNAGNEDSLKWTINGSMRELNV